VRELQWSRRDQVTMQDADPNRVSLRDPKKGGMLMPAQKNGMWYLRLYREGAPEEARVLERGDVL
jgi:hypothetical protein